MTKIILNSLIATLVFSGGIAFAETDTTSSTIGEAVVCTQDAKQCSDGSYVSRTGPECEFTKCPNSEKEKVGLMQRVRNLFENKKPEVKNKTENRVASSTEKKVEKRYEKMAKKYLATIEREETIMAKIVSRIEKIKFAGGKTVEAERLVREAKTHLTEARTAYEILKTTATSADTFEKIAKETLSSMKDNIKVIEKHLRLAHKLLEKTVGSLRGVSQLRNATSTKED